MDEFVQHLLLAAERAATIARCCREEEALFRLLVEEKRGEDNTKLCGRDFKTLADVLIQETITHYIAEKFPSLQSHIYGEESNQFTNAQNQSVTVRVCDTEQATAEMLTVVMDGNERAAQLLARAVHQPLELPPPAESDRLRQLPLDLAKLGVWIDPIDCTSEYIDGLEGVAEGGVYLQGMQCVTVLVGVFDLSTGEPVVGVVNQPFWRRDPSSGRWSGRQVWGVSMGGRGIASLPPPLTNGVPPEKVCVISESDMEVMNALQRAGWKVLLVRGAGYKQLCVIEGVASAFLLTKSSCYKWDTCGPHAILRACGGGMVNWGLVKKEGRVREKEMALRYHCPDVEGLTGPQQWRNDGGILAYAQVTVCAEITNTFTQRQ